MLLRMLFVFGDDESRHGVIVVNDDVIGAAVDVVGVGVFFALC